MYSLHCNCNKPFCDWNNAFNDQIQTKFGKVSTVLLKYIRLKFVKVEKLILNVLNWMQSFNSSFELKYA